MTPGFNCDSGWPIQKNSRSKVCNIFLKPWKIELFRFSSKYSTNCRKLFLRFLAQISNRSHIIIQIKTFQNIWVRNEKFIFFMDSKTAPNFWPGLYRRGRWVPYSILSSRWNIPTLLLPQLFYVHVQEFLTTHLCSAYLFLLTFHPTLLRNKNIQNSN